MTSLLHWHRESILNLLNWKCLPVWGKNSTVTSRQQRTFEWDAIDNDQFNKKKISLNYLFKYIEAFKRPFAKAKEISHCWIVELKSRLVLKNRIKRSVYYCHLYNDGWLFYCSYLTVNFHKHVIKGYCPARLTLCN